MMKLFAALKLLLEADETTSPTACLSSCVAWYRDPLAHPAVERMGERELADLPFDRGRKRFPSGDG